VKNLCWGQNYNLVLFGSKKNHAIREVAIRRESGDFWGSWQPHGQKRLVIHDAKVAVKEQEQAVVLNGLNPAVLGVTLDPSLDFVIGPALTDALVFHDGIADAD
jgi:hypothetical protein